MSNNKTSPRLSAGFFGGHYKPSNRYKDLVQEDIAVSKQEEKTKLVAPAHPTEPGLKDRTMQSILQTCLQPQNPLAIFKKD